MDPYSVPSVEADRQRAAAATTFTAPPTRRRGRPAHQRTAPTSLTNTLRELIARIKAPGRTATLRDVVATLHDTPLGRHGVQSVRALTENARAHRELFAVYPEAVAA